jgi:hypothetical protein
MTNTVDSAPDSGTAEVAESPSSAWPARVRWGLFIVAYLAFAIITIATAAGVRCAYTTSTAGD